jgi:hypothetical protein
MFRIAGHYTWDGGKDFAMPGWRHVSAVFAVEVNTPWNLVRLTPGFGTTAQACAKKSLHRKKNCKTLFFGIDNRKIYTFIFTL